MNLSTKSMIFFILAIPAIIIGVWFCVQATDEILFGLTIVFWVTLGMVILALVAVALGIVWRLWQRGRLDKAQADQAQREAHLTTITAKADEQVFTYDGVNFVARHRDPRIVAGDHQWTSPNQMDLATYAAWLQSQTPRAIAAPGMAAPEISVARPLLEAIANMECGLIVGARGSGKTTLLQHIIARRPGDILILDPHDDTVTWPGNAQVVGGGQDYDAIESALVQFAHKVKGRYRERYDSQGQAQFSPLCLVFDEWFEIFEHVDSAAHHMKITLTGGRKINTCLVLGSHSERVKPLALEGAGDLKKGFYVVRLKGDEARGFSATLDIGEGEQDIQLPGPYAPASGQVVNPQLPPPMGEKERRVLELHEAGKSITAIGAEVFSDGSKGGDQNKRVKEVLRNNGIWV